jgi:hypothetical protein
VRLQQTRFEPGDEATAQRYLARKSVHGRLWLIPNTRAKVMLIVGPLAAAFIVWAVEGATPDEPLLVLAGLAVLMLAFLSVPLIVLIKQGLFVLDPERSLVRYRRTDIPFSKLRVPRVTSSAVEQVSVNDLRNVHYRTKFTTLESGAYVFFRGDSVSRRKVEKIAEVMNSMIAEYDEKRAVEAWLRERGAQEPAEDQDAGGSS